MLVLTMAVLWLPISVHCELEEIPALQFLSCCPTESAPHQDDDCETDGCAVVESGLYKTEERQASIPTPNLAVCAEPNWLLISLLEPTPAFAELPFLHLPPPEIPAGWRFAFRTALPPRAPSFVS